MIESVVSLGIASITVTALLTLLTNISRVALRISQAHHDVIATTKAYAALSSALRTRERCRLAFAVQSHDGDDTQLTYGGEHPLSRLTGASAPRRDSDILSVIDVAQRCRGNVTQAMIRDSSISATVCGLTCRIRPDEFKSYLLYAIDGVRQIVGEVTPVSPACAEIQGTIVTGLVTQQRSFTSSPLVFAPVDREYSLFVDGAGTFRIASHVGTRVLENQPITHGLKGFKIEKSLHAQGAATYRVVLRPQAGKDVSTILVPGLAERNIWNEILP
jgi:hypothetical protein